MNLSLEMKHSLYEIQLMHLKKSKKKPLTLKAADHILKNYKKAFHPGSPVSLTKKDCLEFMGLFQEKSPAELAGWMESLFL